MRGPGRPRFRPRVRRLNVELDEAIFERLEEISLASGAPFRAMIEEALREWLARHTIVTTDDVVARLLETGLFKEP